MRPVSAADEHLESTSRGGANAGGWLPAPLRKNWRRILAAGLAVAGLAMALAWLAPATYKATVTILPRHSPSQNDLVGRLANVTGISLGNTSNLEEHYAEIVHSDRVLDVLVARQYHVDGDEEQVTLFEVFGYERGDDADERRRAAENLKRELRRRAISFYRDRYDGFMELTVTVPRHPDLAPAIANGILAELDAFARQFHQGKATEQREFLEDRLAMVVVELESAQDSLTRFVEQNQAYSQSPALLVRFQNLSREVEAHNSVWIELRRKLEIAKIDEQKNLASVDVLDRATVPVRRTGPRRALNTAIGFLLGSVFMSGLVLLRGRP